LAYFSGPKFFDSGYLAHYLSARGEIWQRLGLVNRNLFTEFRELWSGGPVIACGDMHQSFTDTLVKWLFDNFPIFADSFSVLSIHCVTRGLHASCFLYKCPASRGGSLRQHGLLVTFCVSCRRRKMYCGHARLCVCLSVCPRPYAHTTARTRM